MAAETLQPTPRGKWEKAAISSQWWLLFTAIFLSNLFRDLLGFWESIAAVVAVMGLAALLVGGRARREVKVRRALDAERGLMECAIRYADAHPDSLAGRWLPGYAEVTAGSVRFQSDYVETGSPSGRITLFSDVILRGSVDPPARKPAEFKRGWQVAALGTDKGILNVATSDTGAHLLEDRLGIPPG